jgi:membrane protease subunit (stomatin/prohibitin family)
MSDAAGAIADVIKYEGDNATFIWKHPLEDFNTTTQLIVHESQEAIFFLNGQALDLFGPGRHTLETQNIPLIKKVMNLPTGGQTPFHCEVYFINKVEQMAIRWGTNSKIQYLDPEYGFPLSIGASGEMSLRAEDSRRLLVKLVGTENWLSQTKLTEYFRMFLNVRIKSYIAKEMAEKHINIFEVDARLVEFSDDLKAMLMPDFSEYGVALEQFFVTVVVKPDGDQQYEEFKALHFRQYADIKDAQIRQNVGVIEQETDAKRTVIEAQGIAQKRQLEGYTYQQERGFDVAEKVAQNEGVGEFSNMGIGLGMMAGIGGGVGASVGGVVNDAMGSVVPGAGQSLRQTEGPAVFCDNCGSALGAGSTFCDQCGTSVQKESCLQCGLVFTRPGKFCPKCGAMRGGTNE